MIQSAYRTNAKVTRERNNFYILNTHTIFENAPVDELEIIMRIGKVQQALHLL